MSIHDLQRTIGAWSRRQFPDQTDETVLAHLEEEVAELRAAVELEPSMPENWIGKTGQSRFLELRDEIGGCLVLLAVLADRNGIDLEDTLLLTHRVNLRRHWELKPELGYHKHTKETS